MKAESPLLKRYPGEEAEGTLNYRPCGNTNSARGENKARGDQRDWQQGTWDSKPAGHHRYPSLFRYLHHCRKKDGASDLCVHVSAFAYVYVCTGRALQKGKHGFVSCVTVRGAMWLCMEAHTATVNGALMKTGRHKIREEMRSCLRWGFVNQWRGFCILFLMKGAATSLFWTE